MEKHFLYDGSPFSIGISHSSGTVQTVIAGQTRIFSINRISEFEWILNEAGRSTRVHAARTAQGRIFVHCNGQIFTLDEVGKQASPMAGYQRHSDGKVLAAMPGKVIKILVETGAEIRTGDPLIVLESMKMENTQESPCNGRVMEIVTLAGSQVDAGTVLMRLQPETLLETGAATEQPTSGGRQ
jgi:biotin carboxyl carrier protein